jgi:(p)ppGpp synthase/HD superfamily hydrolase
MVNSHQEMHQVAEKGSQPTGATKKERHSFNEIQRFTWLRQLWNGNKTSRTRKNFFTASGRPLSRGGLCVYAQGDLLNFPKGRR